MFCKNHKKVLSLNLIIPHLLLIHTLKMFGQVDTIEIKKQYSICKEYMNQKNYTDALPAWRFLFLNAAERYQGIYIWGNELYKDLIKKEKEQTKKEKLIDTLFLIYDKRLELAAQDPKKFGDVGEIKGRKAFDMILFRKEKEDYIFQLLKESVEARKENSSPAIISQYFVYASNKRKTGKMDCENLVNLYGILSEYLETAYKIKQDSAVIKAQANLDKLSEVCMDCKTLLDMYQKNFQNKKTDAEWVKKAAENLERKECHKKEEFKTEQVLGFIFEENAKLSGTADAFYKLAVFYLNINQNTNGENYLQKSIELEEDPEKKAQYLYLKATIRFQAKDYIEARNLAKKAAQLKPNWGDPYILIGDMYRLSSCGDDACSKGGPVWAAVDKYIYARQIDPSCGDKVAPRLASAQSLYPSQSECFFLDLRDGDSFRVNCWVDESTTVRTKKD